MTTVWVILGDAFYHSLMFDGWVRVDNYIDGHGLVAMARTLRLSDSPVPNTQSGNLGGLQAAAIADWVEGQPDLR